MMLLAARITVEKRQARMPSLWKLTSPHAQIMTPPHIRGIEAQVQLLYLVPTRTVAIDTVINGAAEPSI